MPLARRRDCPLIRKYNKKLVVFAKNLRNNATKEENRLWYDFLRTHKIKFSRQKVLGKYIADFYSAKARIVIELDGAQHYEDKQIEYDIERTEFFNKYGLTVIRISNLDVNKNFEAVCNYIDEIIKQSLSQ